MTRLSVWRIFFIGLIVLTAYIGWIYLHAYSTPSNAATTEPISVFFGKQKLAVSPEQLANIDIYIHSDVRVSGATITIGYPSALVDFVPPQASQSGQFQCANGLKTYVTSNAQPEKGIVTVTRVTIAENSDLPQGEFCFGTVSFRPKKGIPIPSEALFELNPSIGTWQITGPKDITFIPTVPSEKSKFTLEITDTCKHKHRGDATCDGLIDLPDFESWRKAFVTKGAYYTDADFNEDGKNNFADFEIWRQGFFEQIAGTPTPTPQCIIPTAYCIEPNGPCTIPDPPTGGWCPQPTPTCIPVPSCMLPGANPQCAIKPPPGGWMCPLPSPTPSCKPRPACLDSNPRCMIAEPAEGWCPISPSPIIIDECNWCGMTCVDGPLPPDTMCPAVMPDPNTTCKRVSGKCTVVSLTPKPTGTLSITPSPAIPTSFQFMLKPEGTFTPAAVGEVFGKLVRNMSGYWDIILSGKFSSLQPERQYQVWICGENCSTHSSARFKTDAQGMGSIQNAIINHNQGKDPVKRIAVWEVAPTGEVPQDPTACYQLNTSSLPCLSTKAGF